MATDIVMPRLSDSMEEGTVLTWMKKVGDEVALGEELVEIETDKANMVFESDTAGVLVEIIAEEGATLPIGEVIARVGEAGEAPSGGGDGGGEAAADDAEAPDAGGDGADSADNGGGEGARAGGSAVQASQSPRVHAAEARPDASASTDTDAAADPSAADAGEASPTGPDSAPSPQAAEKGAGGEGDGGRVKASPLARRIARERGVDLGGLSGSGPGGRVIKSDVEAAASAGGAAGAREEAAAAPAAGMASAPAPAAPERPETAKGETETIELTKLQQTVGRRMAESKATAPHFYLQAEIDMSAAWEARARLKASAPDGAVVPSFNDMVVKASALALREFPRANGAYRDGRWELYSRVNVGIAVAAREALVVPTIFDADRKGLTQIATESRALAAKVREAKITPPELSGGTFTVSNLGMYGISNFHAVINSPQAAILAVGAITETPVVRSGEVTTARLMGVTLACDHRILYGADGAEFLGRIRALLEEPLGLAL